MYVALGVTLGVTREVLREVLGLWIAKNEGARFWLPVMNALKTRGTQDILIAIVDGLKGFPEAITAAFPEAMVQTLNFCSWKDRKAVAADLRRIYGAATADLAAAEIDDFEEKWAIEAAFPQTRVQTCIVHLLRHCMNFARFKWEAIDPVDQSSRRTGPQGRRRRPQGDLHGRGCWRRRAGPG